ncbi:hypothetical protein [Pandoraea sp. NPDC087047]|uniref:hypothetical protein n=1 Tax=Pandoraea sp. NPDC087047 TaxID=3364390 RepID=UPI00382805A9
MEIGNRFSVVGVNDERDFCECCGKKGLKRVVWVHDAETDEVKHFGTTCVLSPSKAFGVETELREALDRFKVRERAIFHAAYVEYKKRGGSYVVHPTKSGTWTPSNQQLYACALADVRTRTAS